MHEALSWFCDSLELTQRHVKSWEEGDFGTRTLLWDLALKPGLSDAQVLAALKIFLLPLYRSDAARHVSS